MLCKLLTVILLIALTAASVDTTLYHNDQEIQSQVSSLLLDRRFQRIACEQDPKIMRIVTRSPGAKVAAAIVCNIHAREFFSTETCLNFLKTLQSRQDLVESINFTIFYSANPSRETAFSGDYCLRTDAAGVDLNRNFPSGFTGQRPEDETNPGKSALSETFPRCMDDFMQKEQVDAVLDVHTGEFSIYYWKPSDEEMSVAYKVREVCPNCMFRTSRSLDGSMYSDLKERYNLRWSFVFEIYGGYNQNSATPGDLCWTIFNPTTSSSYDYYLNRSTRMLTVFAEQLMQSTK